MSSKPATVATPTKRKLGVQVGKKLKNTPKGSKMMGAKPNKGAPLKPGKNSGFTNR